jgi:acyl dehydratase
MSVDTDQLGERRYSVALKQDIVGNVTGPWERSWTGTDTLLYSVGVGAGQADPTAELQFTTENSHEVTQQAIPSFAIVLAQFGAPPATHLDGVDFTKLLHAEQSLTLSKPLPVEGKVALRSEVTGLYDKGEGKGAIVESTITATDPASGDELYNTRTSVFIRGEGGWGGDRGPSAPSPIPDRQADQELRFTTSVNQALVYRLTGDRNPLHSDPKFAAMAGFDRPIMHGLGTYGITVRLLVNGFCDGDAGKVSHVDGRFTKPVFPGDELIVSAWTVDGGVAFQTRNGNGDVVLDRGRFEYQ